jgi:alpha-methylacyl-CoA racemase
MGSGDEGPLSGTTVLDLSSVGPASRATRLLADYGARVVKVAAPPEKARGIAPPFYAYGANRQMLRALLDLRDPSGRDAFLAMASAADVVVESFRPGTVERLGIGYEAVRERNPRIVYASTSGYGRSGARSSWAGHDLNYLAVGGFLAMSQPAASGGPPLPGVTVADVAAGGMHAAFAVVAALLRRASTGEGGYLDVSVASGVLWMMSLQVDEHLATGAVPVPGHDVLSGRYACYGTYEAGDGRWLAVAAIEPKFFANLCRHIGCEQWTEKQYDDAAQGEIRRAFASAFATDDRDSWVERLGPLDTCVSAVSSVEEVAADDEYVSAGAFVDVKSSSHGSFRQVGAVLAGSATLSDPVEIREDDATDTEELLTEAGYTPAEISGLRASGVVA